MAQESIDVILSDIRMPRLSGMELFERLKHELRTMPLFYLMTAYSDVSSERAFDQKVDGYFSKPFDCTGLVDAVLHALEQRQRKFLLGKGGMIIEIDERHPEEFEILHCDLKDPAAA